MSALARHGETTATPCRSRVSGRYMPASRQLADRLDKVDCGVEGGFAALRPLERVIARAAAGPIGPEDIEALTALHGVLWSVLERIADDVEGVRELLGVAHA